MKTITCSDRIYYDELLPEESQAIRQDILLYHSILHTTCLLYTSSDRSEFLNSQSNIALRKAANLIL